VTSDVSLNAIEGCPGKAVQALERSRSLNAASDWRTCLSARDRPTWFWIKDDTMRQTTRRPSMYIYKLALLHEEVLVSAQGMGTMRLEDLLLARMEKSVGRMAVYIAHERGA